MYIMAKTYNVMFDLQGIFRDDGALQLYHVHFTKKQSIKVAVD